MPQLSYPGVYIQEESSGVHAITGVATSICAFFGRATRGPINRATRVLSLADYARVFGPPHPSSDLAHSVKQFFDNGGADAYVVRLARGPLAASVTLRNHRAQSVLVATARAEGEWANTVRLEISYDTPSPDDTFNLAVIHESDGAEIKRETFVNLSMCPTSPRFAPSFVSQSSELITLAPAPLLGDPTLGGSFINLIGNSVAGFSHARRPLGAAAANVQATLQGLINAGQSAFDLSVNDGPWAHVDLKPVWGAPNAVPATLALMRVDLEGEINTALSTPGAVTSSFAAPPGLSRMLTLSSALGNQHSVRVRRSAVADLAAALMLGVGQGGIEVARWSNFRPAPTASVLRLGNPANPGDLSTLDAVTALVQNAIAGVTIDGRLIPLNAPPHSLVTTNAAHAWSLNRVGDSAVTGDNDGVREKLRIIAAAINATPGFAWRAEVWGYMLAILARNGGINVRPVFTATGVAAFDNGLLPNVRRYSLGTAGTGPYTVGVDGTEGLPPTLAEYEGAPNARTGFYALDDVDLFNLMVLPGDRDVNEATYLDIIGPASNYCERRRAFLLIDAPASWTSNGLFDVTRANTNVDNVRVRVARKNAAVFYPRIRFSDRGLQRLIGPSGLLAGVFSRTDGARGVWKAPAGLDADLRGIADLEVVLTDGENGVLNKIGANVVRRFPSGFVNWGARTLDGSDDAASEWKYINVRRTALFLEESLYRGTKWVVFEPNDEPLWAKIRLNLNAFMMGLFRQGAFQGTTPDTAYYLKVDAETTTPNDQNLGIVNIEVGFAPLKPAEFVVIHIRQISHLAV